MKPCTICGADFEPTVSSMQVVPQKKRAKRMPKHDLTGRSFKDATVIERAPSESKARWLCQCRCGARVVLYETHLLRGLTGSCVHGSSHTREWASWRAMHDRIKNKNHVSYHRYGGRGIKICDRWQSSFFDFLEDMGPRPDGTTLDRFPNKDGDYEPGNCRWATRQEQQNNLSSNRLVRHEGEELTLAQLARKLGVNYETMFSRFQRGTDLDRGR